MDPTTTEPATQEPGVTPTQPEEQPATAVTTPVTEPTPTTPSEPAEEPAPAENSQESEDPTAFWAKKGIDITTPEGLAKATQSYSEAEKRMHQTTQRSSELEKQLTQSPYEQVSNDPTAQKALETAAAVQMELQVERWKSTNSVTPEQDVAMGEYLKNNEDKAYMLKNGYLSLDDIGAMSGAFKQDTEALKSVGKKEALESLANKQRATAPKGSASVATSADEDPILAALQSD